MGQDEVSERGVLTASDQLWEAAVRQAAVISRLAALAAVGVTSVDAAADELGLSRRQVYVLLRRWRAGGGVVSDLLPGRSSGGRGGSRLPDEVEAIVRQVLQARYLTRQRRSVAAVCREIARLCRVRGLQVPSRGTVLRRIAQLDPARATLAREGHDAARAKRPAGGVPPEVTQLMQQVQMDHTPVDVIVVDALKAAGCRRIFAEKKSGRNTERPELAAALEFMRPGDTLVVPALDRLSRSLQDLITTVADLRARGVGFTSLHENLDTTTPGGRLVFHVFAALAEFIRELIVAGTHEGLAAARARGRVGGRPTVVNAEIIAAT
ncbi:recombinase family protein [Kribbella sp. C-35]|uniref:recombinase family protein n=1 Tax=Kribbella sp. C-35 TaxID=2789276 RepID=UPI00397D6D40